MTKNKTRSLSVSILEALGITTLFPVFQVDEDEPLFLSLINDLFPGIKLDSSTYVELQAAVANQVARAGVVNHPPWNLKLVQVPQILSFFCKLLHLITCALPY